ncbi:Hypothetical protein, putative [Bodo saltans]|uniref:PITH domain-containing protein n=1 Tax=Bodo saltans TaxID=75058 RepID=A0A0S4KLB0_BODSA|nr:Hypothetical protein, putative [Bodo saltans]|eukprot:CUI15187.1 Hypothetical protein, putative [Bodo saltans]
MPCNCRRGAGPHDHVADGVFARDGAFGVGQLLNGHINGLALQAWNMQPSVQVVYSSLFSPHVGEDGPPFVASDADPEVLLFVPFHEVVKIRGLLISGTNDAFAPGAVKLFVNAQDVNGFESVQRLLPEETVVLAQTSAEDAIVYRINPAKFQNVASMTLMVPESFGEDETHLCRIEFYGESTGQPVHRPLATNVVYESMANPADHKIVDEARGGMNIVM